MLGKKKIFTSITLVSWSALNKSKKTIKIELVQFMCTLLVSRACHWVLMVLENLEHPCHLINLVHHLILELHYSHDHL